MTSSTRIRSLQPYFYQFLGRVLPQFVGIGISSLIVTNTGIKAFGHYSLILAIISVTFGVMSAALDTDFQRSCKEENISNVLSVKMTLWLLIITISVLTAITYNYSWLASILLLTGVFLQQSVESIVIKDRIRGEDSRSVLPRLLPVITFFIFLRVFKPDSLISISALFCTSWTFALIYLYPYYRYVKINIKATYKSISTASTIWATLLMTQVYGNIDLYIIKLFHSDEIVGSYKLAYIFSGMVMPVAGVFSFIFLSKISTISRTNIDGNFRQAIRQQLFINIGLSAILIAFMFVAFPYVATYLYGASGPKISHTAKILAVAISLNMLSMVYSYALLALHKEKIIAILTATGATLYAAISFIFIPKYAASGAASAMVLTYIFLLISYVYIFKITMKIHAKTIEAT